MNLRVFSIALLVSAIPFTAIAGKRRISLNPGDFRSAKQISRHGDTIVSVKLSKSGRAKMKKLNQEDVGETIHTEVGGVTTDFKLRELIRGTKLEMGPYSPEEARHVVAAINHK